jgi:hypothetical protein
MTIKKAKNRSEFRCEKRMTGWKFEDGTEIATVAEKRSLAMTERGMMEKRERGNE